MKIHPVTEKSEALFYQKVHTETIFKIEKIIKGKQFSTTLYFTKMNDEKNSIVKNNILKHICEKCEKKESKIVFCDAQRKYSFHLFIFTDIKILTNKFFLMLSDIVENI